LLKTFLDVGVPALVFAAMFVVGMDLTWEDFRRVARRPGVVVAATVGQLIALPAIAWALVGGLHLHPSIAQGVLLVAACPSGAMANLYTYLARSNVALSVSLTAVSCLAGLLTTPVTLGILQNQVDGAARLSVPLGPLAGQLAVLLILPVLAGMYVRHCLPEITKRHGRTLLRVSVGALALLLLTVIVQESPRFVSALPEIGRAASLLTVLAFLAGWATGFISGANATDRFAVGMVFVVRNVGIATAIAVTVLGQSEFAVFATAYFLAQVPILVLAALVFRRLAVAQVATGVERE
jgi:BASS family bile acid:Na+ symporter